MKIGYYPGCSLLGTAREYDESVRAVAAACGIELAEVQDWNCCGATAAHNLNRLLSLALPARTLASAERQGLDELLVPCAACYSRLSVSRHEMAEDELLRKTISEILEMPIEGKARPITILEFLAKHVMGGLKDKITRPFARKVACYYGCLLMRPPKVVQSERWEDPMAMDEIVKAVGAEPLDWAFKVECCGAGFSVSRTDVVARLSGKIVADAQDRGAEAIVVACPMCHSNLDMRRDYIEAQLHRAARMPVLYVTQVVGIALGLSEKALGLHRHFVPVGPLVESLGAAPTEAKTPQTVQQGV